MKGGRGRREEIGEGKEERNKGEGRGIDRNKKSYFRP